MASEEPDDREQAVLSVARELTDMGYAVPQLDAEVYDPFDGRTLAIAEAFWPEGFQSGQGEPVLLELDPNPQDLARLEELGYETYTSLGALRAAAMRRNEVAAGVQTAG